MSSVNLLEGDCVEKLRELEDESVHAVVTDPPYGLAFIGKSWDDFDPKEYQNFCEEWAEECLRVLKPGGHLMAFSGSRTHHRLNCGVEDAGFEIRDQITWHYGSGFPKGSSVDQHIDRYYDAEEDREIVAEGKSGNTAIKIGDESSSGGSYNITKPATDKAEKWEGWNTQLKPATEFIVLARKPISETAVYRNVLKHGTGALNIGSCRVGDETLEAQDRGNSDITNFADGGSTGMRKGRYPANLILSDGGTQILENQHEKATDYFPNFDEPQTRFKYQPKAQTKERNHNGEVENNHPTVKPKELMEWLIKLVTREGQTIIDPFAGSGTTALAADELERNCVLIEREPEYIDIINERLNCSGINSI